MICTWAGLENSMGNGMMMDFHGVIRMRLRHLEGPDGVGKTTQIDLLSVFAGQGPECSSHPRAGRTPISEAKGIILIRIIVKWILLQRCIFTPHPEPR